MDLTNRLLFFCSLTAGTYNEAVYMFTDYPCVWLVRAEKYRVRCACTNQHSGHYLLCHDDPHVCIAACRNSKF